MDYQKMYDTCVKMMTEMGTRPGITTSDYYKGAIWAMTRLLKVVVDDIETAKAEPAVEVEKSPCTAPDVEVLKDCLPAKHPAPAKKKGRKPKVSDEELSALWAKGYGSEKIAKETGMKRAEVNRRLLRIKSEECGGAS